MADNKQPTAGFIIIGNEILSGRTQDTNLNYLAGELTKIGVRLMEVRVVADIENDIVAAVNDLRDKFDYVFTSGGIGPTHDDITSAAIAKAFGAELKLNDEAVKRMLPRYEKPEDLNEARRKMAHVPVGASLIDNPISAAPGFQIENVYVMAGVPDIFRAMIDFVKPTLKGGTPIVSVSVNTNLTEGKIATGLAKIQDENPQVEIGSYPHIRNGKLGVCLVTRGLNKEKVEQASNKIRNLMKNLGGQVLDS